MKETRAQAYLSQVSNILPTISSLLSVGDDETLECISDAIRLLQTVEKALKTDTMEWD